MAARVGHDLVLDVTRWEATVDIAADPAGSAVELSADPRSIEVREGLRGVKPLTGKDRVEILRNIDEKVLGGQPITFRSSAVRLTDGDARLVVEGDLTMSGSTRSITGRLEVDGDGRVQRHDPPAPEQLGDQAVSRVDGRAQGARRAGDRGRGPAAGVARPAPAPAVHRRRERRASRGWVRDAAALREGRWRLGVGIRRELATQRRRPDPGPSSERRSPIPPRPPPTGRDPRGGGRAPRATAGPERTGSQRNVSAGASSGDSTGRTCSAGSVARRAVAR